MKKTSTFQNGLIWFGAGVSLAEILTGTSFAPLGMAKGWTEGRLAVRLSERPSAGGLDRHHDL